MNEAPDANVSRLTRRQATALIIALVVSLLVLTAVLAVWLTIRAVGDESTVADPESRSAVGDDVGASATPEPIASASAPPAHTAAAAPPAPAKPSPELPVAVGTGRPDCSGPCTIDHRLTRGFLPGFRGEQTLLLARGEQADENGEFLHAFLVDAQGRLLWEDHGFGWEWMPVDERFAIRFDEGGHTFFRSYVADSTYLYVLDTAGAEARLVGSRDVEPAQGFPNGEVVERPGEPSFLIRTMTFDCPDGADPNVDDCPQRQTLYRWNQSRYVEA